jgi:hypothetical protein
MTTLNEALITDMGILSDEVYDNIKEYFIFENGERIRSTIATVNGTYTIIDSTDNLNDPNTISSIVGMEALGRVGTRERYAFPLGEWERGSIDMYSHLWRVGMRRF